MTGHNHVQEVPELQQHFPQRYPQVNCLHETLYIQVYQLPAAQKWEFSLDIDVIKYDSPGR